jgi:N-acetylmuramoyl-L-alanine amidase
MYARLTGAIGSTWTRLGGTRLTGAVAAFLCLAAAAASQGAPASHGVVNVRFGGDASLTRVVIELKASTKGQLIANAEGDHAVVFDLASVPIGNDIKGKGLGLVSGWSIEGAGSAVRVRLQLAGPARVSRRFLLPPADGVSVYRYVMDLSATAAPPAPIVAAAAPVRPAAIPVASVTPVHIKKVIVIDAGHGGHDPGASGSDSQEKDVNLAAARALRAKLERTGRYRVVMTRDSDTYVPLETRVQIARRADADLFISLHSDSGADPTLRGATVYTLSDKGSDRTVRGVMDNDDWFINVDLPGRDRAVNQILLDLTQRTTRNRSAAFAEDLIDHISDRVQPQRRSHRDAGFMVLLAPDVPAVLLEMGFITNPQDERLLNDPARRGRFMGAVADSIDAYFSEPTRLASR